MARERYDTVVRIVPDADIDSIVAHGDITRYKRSKHAPILFADCDCPEDLCCHDHVINTEKSQPMRVQLVDSLVACKAYIAKRRGFTGKGVNIAVFDTGCDTTNKIFWRTGADGFPECKVVVVNDVVPDDVDGQNTEHGTNVTGVVAGVAPGANIYSIDIAFGEDIAYAYDLDMAYSWVVDNYHLDIKVVNLSWGSPGWHTNEYDVSNIWAELLEWYHDNCGIHTVVSSGNDGYLDGMGAPACSPNAISVGATYSANWGAVVAQGEGQGATNIITNSRTVAKFTNVGDNLMFYAPGAFITAGGLRKAGTSMAAPHVTGAIAVLMEKYPQESIPGLVDRLKATGNGLTYAGRTIPLIDLDKATE